MSTDSTAPNRGPDRVLAPTCMLEVELGEPVVSVTSPDERDTRRYRQASVLVRLHGKPLGLLVMDVVEGAIDLEELWRRTQHELAGPLAEHLHADGFAGVASAARLHVPDPPCAAARERARSDGPYVSVIIATHQRTTGLRRTLSSVLALDYSDYEVVVVDNAPSTEDTRELLMSEFGAVDKLRYVAQEIPGLTPARIRGVEAAAGEIVAFTDDDVVVDTRWLAELVSGFDEAGAVACVTGLTLPLELDTPAQILFEQYGGFGKGFEPRLFDLAEHRPGDRLFPYAIGRIGSGNNMAWRKDLLARIGGFDLALTKTGAEDISAFFDAITEGYRIAYEPGAIVFHEHRRDYSDLQRQVYWYGIGLGAYLARCLTKDPRHVLRFVGKAPLGLAYLLSPRSPKNIKKTKAFPPALTRTELRGMWRGASAYLRASWRLRGARQG
jgi:GT2 family glycosyltransferase